MWTAGMGSKYQKCIKVIISLRNYMRILVTTSFCWTMILISISKAHSVVILYLPVSFVLVVGLFRKDFPIFPKVVSVAFKTQVYFVYFHYFLMNELTLAHCKHYRIFDKWMSNWNACFIWLSIQAKCYFLLQTICNTADICHRPLETHVWRYCIVPELCHPPVTEEI